MKNQIPSIVLPYPYIAVTDVETVADALVHTGQDIWVANLRMMTIHVVAIEVVPIAGAAGPLWAWIELSPYPAGAGGGGAAGPHSPLIAPASSASFWSAIGGGGGALAPVAPTIIAGIGVTLTSNTFHLGWSTYSGWARVRIQTPIPAVGGSFWTVQAQVEGRS